MAIITWNSVPDYDEWGWDTHWNCNDWIQWHKTLIGHFGEATATEIWNYAFAKTTNLSANLSCQSFSSSFRAYAKKYNLKVNKDLITETFGTITDIGLGGLDTTSEVASGIFGTVKSVLGGDNLKRTINIALIFGGVIGLAYVYKSFKK